MILRKVKSDEACIALWSGPCDPMSPPREGQGFSCLCGWRTHLWICVSLFERKRVSTGCVPVPTSDFCAKQPC